MERRAPLSFTSTEVSASEHRGAIAAARCARRRRGWDISWAHSGRQLLRSAEGSVLMPGAPPVTSPPAKFRRSDPLPCSALYGRRDPHVSAFPVLSLSGPASGPRRPGVSRALPGRAGSPGWPSSRFRPFVFISLYLFHIFDARFKNSYLLIGSSK
jgi:hypothetical protein